MDNVTTQQDWERDMNCNDCGHSWSKHVNGACQVRERIIPDHCQPAEQCGCARDVDVLVDKMVQMCELAGYPPVPWQVDMMRRWLMYGEAYEQHIAENWFGAKVSET